MMKPLPINAIRSRPRANWPRTCTEWPVTSSQPGISVSTSWRLTSETSSDYVVSVGRHYQNLTNQFGGKGRVKPADCDSMRFSSVPEADAYMLARGYTQDFFYRATFGKTKEAQDARIARRLARSLRPKKTA